MSNFFFRTTFCIGSLLTLNFGYAENKKPFAECFDYFDVASKNPALFVGIGTAATLDNAATLARIDLAKQIRTKITSSSSLKETNKSSSYESEGNSQVSEMLVGSTISKRCSHENIFGAVVTLHKELLLKNLSNRVSASENVANNLNESISKSPSLLTKISLLNKAKKYSQTEFKEIEDDYNLCKNFNGCSNITLENNNALIKAIEKNIDINHFKLTIENPEAANNKEFIIKLLENEGILASENEQEGKNLKIYCKKTEFPRISGTEMLIVEVTCTAVASVNGKQVLSYNFKGKGVGETPDVAISGARNQLAKE